MPEKTNSYLFSNDSPNIGSHLDRLGFGAIAERLAAAIVNQATDGGLVFGIEGPWGSGKSSLIARLEQTLKSRDDPPEIVNFSPWLIKSRDALLDALFEDLSTAIRRIATAAEEKNNAKKSKSKKAAKEIAEKADALLGSYASSVGRLAKLARIAELVVPGAALAGATLEAGSSFMESFGKPKEIVAQKERTATALRELNKRIVVFIDDLDRLEPQEAVEVLRLVRAVADFPNVIYVMSYDRQSVTHTLESTLDIENGDEFMEKFVQVDFRLPIPEAFALRRWFRDEVTELFSSQLLDAENSDQRDVARRLNEYIDSAGGRYLQTPRDVVRTLNALRLYGPSIVEQVYLPDLVWLQLVRSNDPELHKWVEAHVTVVAAIAGGASVSSDAEQRALDQLKKALASQDRKLEEVVWELHGILPGVDWDTDKIKHPDGWKLLNGLSDTRLRKWVTLRRLGSPHHFRYYFSLTKPEGVLTDARLLSVVEASTDAQNATESLRKILARPGEPTGATLDRFLDRLLALSSDELPASAIPALLAGLANVVDEASSKGGRHGLGVDWLAVEAERAFRELFKRLSPNDRMLVVKQMFGHGKAIGWLVGLLADDVYARGLAGEDSKGSHETFFDTEEFEIARSVLVVRLKNAGSALLDVPRLLPTLYGWNYLGDPSDVASWCKNQIESDAGLLAFLGKSRGWANATGIGVYYPLNRKNLSEFIDYDLAKERVERLFRHAEERDVRTRAKELLEAFKQGEES
ncbi:KAP family P-loop NTPase fold protein [Hyphomicrobium album]|nr:KAP family NTPase [Hyphomicrobium album]